MIPVVHAVTGAVKKMRCAHNSPPKLGGVPASVSEQAGWFQSRMPATGLLREPPRLAARGTPPKFRTPDIPLEKFVRFFDYLENSATANRMRRLVPGKRVSVLLSASHRAA